MCGCVRVCACACACVRVRVLSVFGTLVNTSACRVGRKKVLTRLLWEIGDARNRNSAVNRRRVNMDRETTSLGEQKRVTVTLER